MNHNHMLKTPYSQHSLGSPVTCLIHPNICLFPSVQNGSSEHKTDVSLKFACLSGKTGKFKQAHRMDIAVSIHEESPMIPIRLTNLLPPLRTTRSFSEQRRDSPMIPRRAQQGIIAGIIGRHQPVLPRLALWCAVYLDSDAFRTVSK